MSAKAPADQKHEQKNIMFSSGRGGSGNIRRVKSTKEVISRPLASPKMLELEPPRNRAAYGGRGGSGNIWTHVIEEGVFDRVVNHEISRARVLKEERAYEKAERRRSGAAARMRRHSDAKLTYSDARSVASASSRKSWVSTSEVCVVPRSPERLKSFANTFLAPLRNTFRSKDARSSAPDLAQYGSESGHSAPSSDQASLSGVTTHLSPSTPNLSPSNLAPPLPLPTTRRWTASGQRPAETDLALKRTRYLSNPLPPPTQPIPPIPHVHFVPQPPTTSHIPTPISPDDRSPPTPIDDAYGLLDAAAAAVFKARPSQRRSSRAALSRPVPSPPSPSWHHTTTQPPRARVTTKTQSHSGARRRPNAIPSGSESDDRAELPTARDSEGDLIDPSLLSDDGRCSGRAYHTPVPTVSSLSSILPWLQDHDLDSIIPALSNAE